MKKEITLNGRVETIDIIKKDVVEEIFFNLLPKEIIEAAYDICIPGERPGFAVLNLQSGELEGRSIDDNDYLLPLEGPYITIYRIGKNLDASLWPLDILSKLELAEFWTEGAELNEFVVRKGINKKERTIEFLMNYYEKDLYDLFAQIESWYTS